MLIRANPTTFKNGLSDRKKTTRIVVHHSASDFSTTIYDVYNWHIANGWSGIGYHYIVYSDGTVYRGRPENKTGAHAFQDSKHEANSDGIGICIIGNFQTQYMTAEQMDSLVWLIKDIRERYGKIPVIGHKDVMPTACPGSNFPWAALNRRLEDGTVNDDWKKQVIDRGIEAGILTEDHNPTEPAEKWFVVAVMLNLLNRLTGKEG